MPVVPYFGSYARFSAQDREQSILLMGADCIVGDELSVVVERAGADDAVWLENRFGGRCGLLDGPGRGSVLLCRAKGWNCRVLLASVYCSADEEAGLGYWGEVVIVAYPQTHAAAFEVFVRGVADLLAEGVRPQVDLQQSAIAQIVETGGEWLPRSRVPALASNGSALVKDHRSFKEGMVEQARARNPGCMAVGWAFIVLVVCGAVWLARGLFGA